MNREVWRGSRIFITGHTGFKGGWLSCLLAYLGAKVTGYALPPESFPCLFDLASVSSDVAQSHFADIRDSASLRAAMLEAAPDVVIHLAAQPLVRSSYRDPVQTWTTNVLGTVNLLEAVRVCPSVHSVLIVTSDKCYENKEWAWGYREIDALGGYDPYSASKASTEIVVASYRQSFFSGKGVQVSTARAGNVIGGGDWSEDRLIPDAVRAISAGDELIIRNPDATRPWQHVLEALNGYLVLLEHMHNNTLTAGNSFNFGPTAEGNRTVREVLDALNKSWPELVWRHDKSQQPHEARALFLDTSLARNQLKWAPRWSFDEGIRHTAEWYRQVLANPRKARAITLQQINKYYGW